jgi:hypothetical protein
VQVDDSAQGRLQRFGAGQAEGREDTLLVLAGQDDEAVDQAPARPA